MAKSLLKGCTAALADLDLGGNLISRRDAVVTDVERFFTTSAAIQRLDLSGTQLPPRLLDSILASLEINRTKRSRSWVMTMDRSGVGQGGGLGVGGSAKALGRVSGKAVGWV